NCLAADIKPFRNCIDISRLPGHHADNRPTCRIRYGLENVSSGFHYSQVYACKYKGKYLIAQVPVRISLFLHIKGIWLSLTPHQNNQMDTIIRNATENDLPAILEIYNRAILHTTTVYDYEPHTIEMRERWFEDKHRNGFPILVAEQDGDVSGFASYGPFRTWAAYRYTAEHSVYVQIGRASCRERAQTVGPAGPPH